MDAMTGIASPPTTFRSSSVGPTYVGAGVQAAVAPTRLGPMGHPDIAPQFGAASTRLAPAAPPLAYSMTGNMEALTAYVPEYEYEYEYESGPNDRHEAQWPHDVDPDASDPDRDAPDEAPQRPARKSLLLVGSLAAAFIGIGVSILTTAVVITVTPAADQKPVRTQQPVPTPLATRVSEPPVVTPASAPVQPPPAPQAPPPPPAVAPAPQPRVIPRQAPPRATQATPRVTQTSSPSDQELAPGDVPQHPSQHSSDVPPADGDGGPPPDERDVPSHHSDPPLAGDGDGPPPRSHSPFSPHLDEPPAADGGGEPRRGGGGLLGGAGCIPLLPC